MRCTCMRECVFDKTGLLVTYYYYSQMLDFCLKNHLKALLYGYPWSVLQNTPESIWYNGKNAFCNVLCWCLWFLNVLQCLLKWLTATEIIFFSFWILFQSTGNLKWPWLTNSAVPALFSKPGRQYNAKQSST